MDWISLIQTLGGVIGGLGIGMFTKSGRKRDKADADLKVQEAQAKMIDNYEERIKDLHSTIAMLNESEAHYIERISAQNKAIDSKTEQIRSLTQQTWESQQQLNEANTRITSLTEERDNYRNWHCRKGHCADRQPPNPALAGQTFPGDDQ